MAFHTAELCNLLQPFLFLLALLNNRKLWSYSIRDGRQMLLVRCFAFIKLWFKIFFFSLCWYSLNFSKWIVTFQNIWIGNLFCKFLTLFVLWFFFFVVIYSDVIIYSDVMVNRDRDYVPRGIIALRSFRLNFFFFLIRYWCCNTFFLFWSFKWFFCKV